MVETVKQLCIESFEIEAENGDYFKAQQGEEYTTTFPDNDGNVVVFSNFWVTVPATNFVIVET